MKNHLLYILLAAVVFTACETKRPENLMTVSGSIDGLKKGKLYLQRIGDSTLINIDSLDLKGDGNFSFSQELESPELFYLHLEKADNNEYNDRISFFGEPGEIFIKTAWNTFDTKSEIMGSTSNEKFMEVQQMLSNFNKRDLELIHLSTGMDSLALDSLQVMSERNLKNRYLYVLNFAFNNKDSHVTPYIMMTEVANTTSIKYLDSLANSLTPEVGNGKYGKAFKSYVEELKGD